MATAAPSTFGALLKRYRLAAGLTQEALAERAGLSARGVQDLERGVHAAPRAETVRLLAEALGLDPGARAALVWAAHPEAAAPAAPLQVRPGLRGPPAPATPLVGREREVAEACALLRQAGRPTGTRLLTLTGPGGVGKTRLALAVAAELSRDFADGVAWVELAPLRDPTLVAPAVARALGVREGGGEPLDEALAAAVSDRRLLLVVDNCEHLLPAAPLLAALLAAGPGVTVLATSRARLRLRGEREFPVAPLALPPAADAARSPPEGLAGVAAVRLFGERAAEVRPGFALTAENAAAVAEICRRLDGLPLALELAAARAKVLPPAALLERLGRRLPLLTGAPRDAPSRQRTMRDAITWSHDLLSGAEQEVFRRLSAFAGGFALDAAEAIAGGSHGGPNGPVLDLLASLADQSLVRAVDGPAGEPRFTLLETVREYALERLEGSGESEPIRQAHAAYYLALAERAEPELTGPGQAAWLGRLEAEHDNLRAALAWSLDAGEAATGLRLVGALWRFWWVRGHLSEGRRWAEAALAGSGGTGIERARALQTAGGLALEQGDYEPATPLLEAALALAQEAGERDVAALCLSDLGFIARDQGASERAAALHGEALALQRQTGDRRGVACSLANLGTLALNQGAAARAEDLFAEALATFRAVGDWMNAAQQLSNLATLANQRGDHQRACRLAEEALVTCRDLGERETASRALSALATAARGQGDLPRAGVLYGEALARFRELGHQPGIAETLAALAGLALDEGPLGRALPLLAESLGILRRIGNQTGLADSLEAAARAASAGDRWERAALLAGAAAALREAIGVPAPRAADEGYRRALAAARSALDEPVFAAAHAAGRGLPLEQAIAEALALAEELAAGAGATAR